MQRVDQGDDDLDGIAVVPGRAGQHELHAQLPTDGRRIIGTDLSDHQICGLIRHHQKVRQPVQLIGDREAELGFRCGLRFGRDKG